MMTDYKRKPVPVKRVSVADGISAGRETIKVARFDADRCATGIEGLRAYRREWDDDLKRFRDTPVKDWAEHIGSAFRYLGLSWQALKAEQPKPVARFPAHMTINELVARQARKLRGDD
jgi:hypothetical protein